jgi:1-acyl-sn-glycerol-3-phosphate acyltransferase
LSDSTKKKPFHKPPIQSGHWGYELALQLVRASVTRFHRIQGVDGFENITDSKTPTIVVANHQNGLMDPLVLVSLVNNSQVHWLTRADIFYKKMARSALFSFNQMPIYRQRDRLSDARERNVKIFEVCAERLRIGARMGLFPEGNHRAMRSLRPLRRGVSDMVNASLKLDPSMRQLQILPVGIDYEEMSSFRRRLRYRIGAPIKIDELINTETNEVAPGDLLEPLMAAMDEILVNIQPEKAYETLLPYVRAMRTTECDDWGASKSKIDRFQDLDDGTIAGIQEALEVAKSTGLFDHVRVEDMGMNPLSLRKKRSWLWLLAPLAFATGISSFPVSKWIESQVQRRVKDPCFISTSKAAAGMVIFPVYWLLISLPIAYLATGDVTFTGVMTIYLFHLLGSRFAGWWYGLYLDETGRKRAQKAWAEEVTSKAWMSYLGAVDDAIKPTRSSFKFAEKK